MDVFKPGRRVDVDAARHGESHWSYLNRSARDEFAAARELINGWFRRLCQNLQPGVRNRLQSGNDQEFASAFWELFLHEMLIRVGYDVNCEPVLPNGRKIDFLVTRADSSMYMEATIAHSSAAERAADARRNRIYRELEQVNTTAFMIGIEIERAGQGDMPSARQLRVRLEDWLAGLDPDEVAADWERSEILPTFAWEMAGWSLTFEAYPVRPEHRTSPIDRPLGTFMDETGGAIDDESPLRHALSRKAPRRYGELDHPYVVAVSESPFAPGHSDWHRQNVLYGREAVAFGDGQPPRSVRQPDGFWRGPGNAPRNLRLSAVVFCDNLYPWNPETATLEWWDNPFASKPVSDDLVPPIVRRQQLVLHGRDGNLVATEPSFSTAALFAKRS